MSSPGSSPLTRGKPARRYWRVHRGGLIPAHAGKTPSRKSRAARNRAHPRSRGENPISPFHGHTLLGSSPLTRGKPPRRSPPKSRPGLIPAHAGKTRTAQGRPSSAGAHPRSRGENPIEPLNEEAEAGSSPLTRGKPGHHRLLRREPGLIPAHAGKTRVSVDGVMAARAHPRSRGENVCTTRSRCP